MEDVVVLIDAQAEPAKKRRRRSRAVGDAIAQAAEGERAVLLTGALRERLERLDTEAEFADRPPEEIIAMICRDLGLDPVRMIVRSPLGAPFASPMRVGRVR